MQRTLAARTLVTLLAAAVALAQDAPTPPPSPAPALVGDTWKGEPVSYWVAELRADDGKRRRAAIWAQRAGSPAVPGLVSALASPDASTRRAAADTLGRLGPVARDAVDPLRDLLRDPDSTVRTAAKRAVAQIETPQGK